MGLDGMRLLTSEDEFEVWLMGILADKVAEMRTKQMQNQATMIAVEVGKLFG
jgi:hypothetical protein